MKYTINTTYSQEKVELLNLVKTKCLPFNLLNYRIFCLAIFILGLTFSSSESLSAQTTVVKSITSATNDCEEEGSGTAGTIGTMSHGSTDIELTEDNGSPTGNQKVGLRFTGLNIPQGAFISSAYMTFRAIDADSPMSNSQTTNLTIVGHKSTSAPTFSTTIYDITNRTGTTANVPWSSVPAWTTGADYNSPDLTSIIQELVNQGGWTTASPIALIITGSGHRSFSSFEGGGVPAKLTITYTTTVPITVNGTVTDESCAGANDGAINITPSGGTPPYSYTWNDGPTSEDRTGLAPGVYNVQVTDSGTGTGAASFVVNAGTGLTLSTSVTQESTPGAGDGAINLTVTGGTMPYTFLWSPGGQMTEDISGLSEGTYSVNVTDACPSTTTTSASLSQIVNKQLYLTPVISTVAVDATSTNSADNPGVTFSVSHTTGSGDNRLMLVGISQKNDLINGVTYGGTPLSLIGEERGDANARVHIYALVNPPTGTADVVVTLDGSPDKGIVLGVTTFTGVNQTNPLGTFASAYGITANPSVSVSSALGELVFDVVSSKNEPIAVGSGQSQLYDVATVDEIIGGGSTESGAATVTMGWTALPTNWAIGAVSIKPHIEQYLDRIDPVATTDNTTIMSAPLGSFIGGPAGSFATPDNISNQWGGQDALYPDLAVYESGGVETVHTVFLGKGTGAAKLNIYYASKTGAGSWTTPVLISNDLFNQDVVLSPSIAVDNSGNAHVVYEHKNTADAGQPIDAKREVYYVTNASGSWSTPLRISSATFGTDVQFPEIAADANGDMHVVYLHENTIAPDLKQNAYYINNIGGSWSTPVRVSDDSFNQDVILNPGITTDANGKAYIVYAHKNTDNLGQPIDGKVNYYYATNASGSWATPERISDATFAQDVQASPSIVLDNNDAPHIVYAHKNGASDAKVNVYYTEKTSGSWSTPYNLSKDINGADSADPDLAITDIGIVRVAFSNADNIYYTENSATLGSPWTIPLDINPTPPTTSTHGTAPSIVVTDDNVHVVYSDRESITASKTDIWHTSATNGLLNNVLTTTFTQSPTLCSDLTITAGQTITVTNYVSITEGTMPASPDITAVLQYGATNIITLSNPTYSGNVLTWTGTLGADVTVPAGQAIALQINVAEPDVIFTIDYDSQTKPSKIELPVNTYINIDSYAVYDAPYPGGSIITSSTAGNTVYLRAVVSDPFGMDDITDFSINVMGSPVSPTMVASGGCTKTYEYVWNTTGASGNESIPATAEEGFEGTVTDVEPLILAFCSPIIGDPVFAIGASSTRCQGAGSVTYTATSTNSTGMTYSLNGASMSAGNSINTSTGEVTYVAGWTGTSTITAEAAGCGGPTTATHTVTTTPTVGTPVFNLGATSIHCKAGGNVTYTASATNATGITYSLDGASLTGGNTINSTTGEVTYAPTWAGTTTITASAAGCNGPATANHVITINSIVAVDDNAFGYTGEPLPINLAANDLCDVDDSSITITTDPIMGSVQIGTGGNITYLPNGAGTDQFTYSICSNSPIVCDEATVIVIIEENIGDVCAEANDNKTYYLPFPENSTQLRKALLSSASTNQRHSADVKSIFTLSSLYPGTIVTYDHWEDGYESNVNDPQQSTTLVWGDGDISNGDVSVYCALCTGDNIPAGGDIIIENIFNYNPRNSSTIVFDGKDKVVTSSDVSISKIAGDNGDLVSQPGILFSLQNVKTNVLDVTRFGKLFVIPFGEDISGAAFGNTGAFKYASIFVRAATDGTVVNLDYDGDGTIDEISPTLNEGEVWFYDGTASTAGVPPNVNNSNDIKAGAIVTANHDVGVDLVFGGIDSYGTRNVAILPGEFYNNTYYSPVYSTNTDAPVYAFFTNTSSSAIIIDWSNGASGSGTLPIAAKSSGYLNLNAAAGYKFESQSGETYTAIVVIDADASSSAYDWAFNLIPENRLTNVAGISWAPGGATAGANHAPVWVTPMNNSTTIYIKYDGDFTNAGIGTSPCGLPYDATTTLNALQSYKILDPDNDQTGLVVYTCEEEDKLAVAWGEDPIASTPTGSPGQDVGYVMEPKCISQLILANDDYGVTLINTPITVNVPGNDAGFLVTPDPTTVSTTGLLQPTDGTTMVNPDGTITYSPDPSFVGVDTFEYIICSIEDVSICDIATVYIAVSCRVPGLGQNGIYGTIFEDINLDTLYGLGESGLSGITVLLYEDNNQDGAVDAGDTQVDTDDTDADGNYDFSITLPAISGSITYNNTTSGTLNSQANCTNQLVRTFNVTENISITDLNVGLNLAHTWRGDMRVQLTSPSNTTVTLIAQTDDSDDNYNLLLDDSSANPYDNGAAADPLTPLYQLNRTAGPANSLSAFNSESTQGTWTLRICNTNFSSSGGRVLTYNSARLTFTGNNNTQKYYVMEIDQGTLPTGASLTTDNVETAVFSLSNISDCYNDFGLNLNYPPVSTEDDFTVCANEMLTGDLFADNGNGADIDPDGNSIMVAQVNGSGANVGSQFTLPSGALLLVNSNGSFTYDANGQFAAGGTETFTYAANDGFVDGNTTTVTISLNALPTMSCPANQTVCESALPLDLSGLGATPLGGTFSGTGVTGTNYSASAGTTNTVTYTFTDGNGCTNSCTFEVTVNALPTMSCPANETVCESALPLDLSGLGATPIGGTFSGTGVTGTNYSAIAGTTNTVTYSFTDGNGCTNSCTFEVTVNALPTMSCPANQAVCESALPLDLSGLGATPTGGTFSGTGVTGTNYSATGGTTNTVTYTFTDGNGCTNSCTFEVTVNALPTMSCPANETVCESALPLDLSGLGATPIGGTFSGTGVTGTNYSANGGTTNTVTYTFTDGNGCSNSCTFEVTVNATPAAPEVSPVTYCQDDTPLRLWATGSNLLWYTVSTGGAGSATAPTPSTATAGNTSYFVSQTVNGCEGPRAEIVVTVNATPAAPISGGNIEICDDQTGTLTATVGAGQTIDWYDASTGGHLLLAGSTTYQTPIAGTYYAQTRVVSDGCVSNSRIPVQLTVVDCPCDISSLTETPIYNDNGTPNDVTDDTFTFQITINGTGATGWETESINGNLGEPMIMGPYPVGEQGVTLNINLVDRPSCSLSISANQSPCIYLETCTCCGSEN